MKFLTRATLNGKLNAKINNSSKRYFKTWLQLSRGGVRLIFAFYCTSLITFHVCTMLQARSSKLDCCSAKISLTLEPAYGSYVLFLAKFNEKVILTIVS